jgi:DNA-binding IclR family transcriptional regulator
LVTKTDGPNDGTQAIRRAASILRQIAKTPQTGSTLRELSEAMELSRSTTHRILKCLVSEKLVAQSDDARRYSIGELAAELGLAVKGRKDVILTWRPAIEALARDTGATTYLMGRSGSESVCLDKAEGSSVIRVIPVEVGQRRPLGLGAGATAILAAMLEPECEATIAAIEPYLHRYGRATADDLRKAVAETRATGFAESWGKVVDGVYGLGIAVPSDKGGMLALSIATHQSLATEENIQKWKQLLKAAASLQ